MRADGRAVLIVDHNVKSISALVDRVYAMYVGERIAEGTVEEVMANETVRRVYLGGALETAARPETAFGDAQTPFLEIEQSERRLRQGAGAGERLAPCPSGRIRRRRRAERRRQDDAVQRHLGPHPLCRRHSPRRADAARQNGGDDRARRDRAVAGRARTVRRHDGQRESRHGRPPARRHGSGPSARNGCSTCSRS